MAAHRLRYWGLKILTLWGILLTAFVLPHLVPGSPLPLYESWPAEPQQRAGLIAAYGFDRPLPVQYLIWMQRLATGQWGASRYYHQPVFRDSLRALGFTSLLLVWTAIAYGLWRLALAGTHRMWQFLGISLGQSKGLTLLDALPKFLVAVILHDLAVWRLGWTDFANVALFVPYPYLNPLIMLLPASVLALIPLVLRQAQNDAAPVSREPSNRKQWREHERHLCFLLRPLLGYLLLEVLLTEHVFALPGLGSFGINALRRRDFPALQGFILGIGALLMLLQVILELSTTSHPSNRHWRNTQAAATSRSRQCLYNGVWGVMVLIAISVWAPRLWLYDPTEIHTHDQLLLSNSRYILGTDFLGRDVFSRTVAGFRSSVPRVAISMALVAAAAGLCLGLKRILPVSFRWVWHGGLSLFEALPPFLLAFLTFLVVEQRSWSLEVSLATACLPWACKTTASGDSLLHHVAILANLAGFVFLLEVSFFYLNLSPEALAPTWGGDLRIGMNYSHLNIWLIWAPTLAVTWSRYLLHELGVVSPLLGVYAPFPALTAWHVTDAGG